MTRKRFFVRTFWKALFFISLTAGSLGLLAVILDYFLFKEGIFTDIQILEFIVLLLMAVFIKMIVIPRFPVTKDKIKNPNHSV